MYQQHPIVVGGGQFPIEKMKVLPVFDRSKITHTIRYWDKAGTDASDNADAAFTAGALMHAMSDGTYVLSHMVRGQWSALDRETKIKTWTEADASTYSSYEVYVEQEPGSGGKESAESTIRNLAGFRVYADKVTGEKVIRAEPFAAQVQGGNIFLVAGDWVGAWYDECECLDKDTLIVTMRGDQPIIKVAPGDFVMTRLGWRRVLKAGCTGRKKLCEITLSNGQRLRTTLDHPIYVPGCGFKKAGTLKVGESLLQFTAASSSSCWGADTSGAMSEASAFYSIGTSGNRKSARSLKTITSTTSMACPSPRNVIRVLWAA
jgi:predicted phage terminase large subunit-like protein